MIGRIGRAEFVGLVVDGGIVRGFDVSSGQDKVEDVIVAFGASGSCQGAADVSLDRGDVAGNAEAALSENIRGRSALAVQIMLVHIAHDHDGVVLERLIREPREQKTDLVLTDQSVFVGGRVVVFVHPVVQVRADRKDDLTGLLVLEPRPGKQSSLFVPRRVCTVFGDAGKLGLERRIALVSAVQFGEPRGLVEEFRPVVGGRVALDPGVAV